MPRAEKNATDAKCGTHAIDAKRGKHVAGAKRKVPDDLKVKVKMSYRCVIVFRFKHFQNRN